MLIQHTPLWGGRREAVLRRQGAAMSRSTLPDEQSLATGSQGRVRPEQYGLRGGPRRPFLTRVKVAATPENGLFAPRRLHSRLISGTVPPFHSRPVIARAALL